MDLRYQSPHRPWGFYGMKDGILLRSPSNTEHVPDWDFYDNQDRYKIIQEQVQHKTVNTHWQYLRKINILTFEVNLEYSRALQWRCNNLPLYKTTWITCTSTRKWIHVDVVIHLQGQDLGEFDPTLTGPHMDAWKIVTHSSHIDAYFAEKMRKEDQKTTASTNTA